MSNGFEEHAKIKANQHQDQQWDFNQNEARQMQESADFKNYKDSWNEKWQIVKDIMCGPDNFECDELDQVLDL